MIITSLLDTDLYKFTMMQVVLHHFPAAQVEYQFQCRTPAVDLAQYIDEIKYEINELCQLSFQENELDYLKQLGFFKNDFIDFLSLFKLRKKYVDVSVSTENEGEIKIKIIGPWLHTILFEIPILAIINEIYCRNTYLHIHENMDNNHHVTQPALNIKPGIDEGLNRLSHKIEMLSGEPDCGIADYGTRRRFSRQWHGQVINIMQAELPNQLRGTSNVYYAMKFGLRPLGTMAHEYLQACQALGPRLRDSQVFAFETWAQEYRGDLGIALSDVCGLKAFLNDFDMYFCKLFDGARHDSGDPFDWAEKIIKHYEKNRCDPKTKTLVFSDGLDIPKVLDLFSRFHQRCKLAFGIGTNLTNDLGCFPLQIVIKMVRCNGQPVAKLPDCPDKNICQDKAYLAYLRQVFNISAAIDQ